MGLLTFKISRWSLQVMENGVRRLDLDILPMSHHSVVEIVDTSAHQRCFIADPDDPKSAELEARLVGTGHDRPHIQHVSATLYDTLIGTTTRKYTDFEAGTASQSILTINVAKSAMDELIRQDGMGRRIFYFDVAIEGISRATRENDEDGLVGWRWERRSTDDEYRADHLSVEASQIHYFESDTYKVGAVGPVLPTKEDIQSLQKLLENLLVESTRINRFTQMLFFLAVGVIILLWRK